MKQTFLVDTNLLLHYAPPDQIDWLEEAGTSEVEILIVPVVLRELDKHKNHNQSKKLRKRAADRIRWINAQLTGSLESQFRTGCYLRYLNSEPLLDFAAHGLSKEVADDWLIGHALELSNESPLTVITADINIRLKCMPYRFDVILWEDNDYRLSGEDDENTKRVQELEKLVQ